MVALLVALAACRTNARASAVDAGVAPGAAVDAAVPAQFEGEIVTEESFASGVVLHLRLTLKGRKMRAEFVEVGGVSASIFDDEQKTSVMLFPDTKEYMVTPLEPTLPSGTPMPSATRRGSSAVLAYACDEWETTYPPDGIKTVTCFASGASFVPAGAGWRGWSGVSPATAAGATGLPLREVTTDASGNVVSTLRAVRVEEKTEPDALFAIPVGYVVKKVAMPPLPR